jgi:hypothetical protein
MISSGTRETSLATSADDDYVLMLGRYPTHLVARRHGPVRMILRYKVNHNLPSEKKKPREKCEVVFVAV